MKSTCLLLLAALASCASDDEDLEPTGPDTATAIDDGKADSSELRVRAANMTVWIDRAVDVRLVDGEPRATVKGRASRTLSNVFSFVPDDGFGEAELTGSRSFAVHLRGGHEINSIFSGLPLLVSLDAPSDSGNHYTLQLDLRPAFSKFSGSSSVFVSTTTRPIFIGKDATDPLRYATRVKASSLAIANAGTPELVPVADGFDVMFDYGDLDAAWRSGAKVEFRAGSAVKRADLDGRASSIALTTLDPYEAWPPARCTEESYNCSLEHQGVDLETCGDYRTVSHCAYADICEITDDPPLLLSPIDLSFAWKTQVTAYRNSCTSSGSWCSLGAIETFMLPECMMAEPSLEAVVAQAVPLTDDQDFAAGPFGAGTVLDRQGVQETTLFSSTAGKKLFGAIDAHMGAGEIRAWSMREPVPCHNCTEFRSKLFLWWPAAFRVVVIESGNGFDS